MSWSWKPVVLGGLSLLLASCGGSAKPTATPIPSVRLPQDDPPHAGYNTEWWYYNGHLQATTGEQYSFHLVVFDIELPGITKLNIYQMGIVDHQDKRYVTGQQRVEVQGKPPAGKGFGYSTARAAPAGPEGEGMAWSVSGGNGADHIQGLAPGYDLALDLQQVNPPALHGGRGFYDFGPGAATYYYSRTRMRASGRVDVQGHALDVTGEAWFDHQWGDFQPTAVRWDWFALQLADGSDVMLFDIRDSGGRPIAHFGSYVPKSGTAQPLAGADFSYEATGSWRSPRSGAAYPMGWRLRVPSRGVDVTLAPVIQDAEFDATSTTLNYYWEGPAAVSGSHAGRAYVEMVGYAKPALPTFSPQAPRT